MKQPRKKSSVKEEGGLTARLKALRKEAGVSQEAIGAQGSVSTPGWIKIENGLRSPSEKLLAELVGWLVQEKIVRAGQKTALIEELCALKYAGHRSPFLSMLARNFLAGLPGK